MGIADESNFSFLLAQFSVNHKFKIFSILFGFMLCKLLNSLSKQAESIFKFPTLDSQVIGAVFSGHGVKGFSACLYLSLAMFCNSFWVFIADNLRKVISEAAQTPDSSLASMLVEKVEVAQVLLPLLLEHLTFSNASNTSSISESFESVSKTDGSGGNDRLSINLGLVVSQSSKCAELSVPVSSTLAVSKIGDPHKT